MSSYRHNLPRRKTKMANHSDKQIEDAASKIGLSRRTIGRLMKSLNNKPEETRGHGAPAQKTSIDLDF